MLEIWGKFLEELVDFVRTPTLYGIDDIVLEEADFEFSHTVGIHLLQTTEETKYMQLFPANDFK